MSGLIGERFGRLTVVEKGFPKIEGNRKRPTWICQCDCGNKITVTDKYLRTGKKTHCGCQTKRGHTAIDMTGEKFGMLTVIEQAEKEENGKYTGARWLCKCDCGNTVVVRGGVLRNGIKTSCGCTPTMQVENTSQKRKLKTLTYKGETKTMKAWAELLDITKDMLEYRLKKCGGNVEMALLSAASSTSRRRGKERCYADLALAIIQQAAFDYRDLRTQGMRRLGDNYEGHYSVKEIEEFFKSDWCKEILTNSGTKTKGEALLGILKTETPNVARQYVNRAKVQYQL